MLDLHSLNGVLVIVVNALAFGWGLVYARRRRPPGRLYAHALALAQALLIAQVATRAPARGRRPALAGRAPLPLRDARAARGTLALDLCPAGAGATVALVRRGELPRGGARDPRLHDLRMSMNPTLRGFVIIVAVAAAITALQLQVALDATLIILRVLFLIAIGFVLYVLWRNNRTEIETWPRRAQVVFYGASARRRRGRRRRVRDHLPVRRARGARVLPRPRRVRLRDDPRLARPALVRLLTP